MLDMVGWPCGPGIGLNVLSMVSLLSLFERMLKTGVVGACEDSCGCTPFVSGDVVASININFVAQRDEKWNHELITLWWFGLSFGVETDFLEIFFPKQRPVEGTGGHIVCLAVSLGIGSITIIWRLHSVPWP